MGSGNGARITIPLPGLRLHSPPAACRCGEREVWGGRYRDRLATGTHLQLAVYASLIEQTLGQSPEELAFFILDSRALLATSDRVFADAQVCSPPADGSVRALLSKAEGSWRWRNQQLDDGVLEVVDLRLAELQEFQGADGTLPVKETGPWNAEYQALLGWENGA